MGLRLGDLTDDQRYDEWIRIIRRIYDEQVSQAWSYYMFRLLRAVFVANEGLSNEGGFIFEWVVRNYVDSSLMLLRRELDGVHGTECIQQLLLDMLDHPTVLTRGRYLSRRPNGHLRDLLAEEAFSKYAGSSTADRVPPDVIRVDLAQLEAAADHLRVFAERTRAHRTPEQGIDPQGMTFGALHDALTEVRAVIAKYYALLTQRVIAQWEAVPQYDVVRPFLLPWVHDRTTVERLAREGEYRKG